MNSIATDSMTYSEPTEVNLDYTQPTDTNPLMPFMPNELGVIGSTRSQEQIEHGPDGLYISDQLSPNFGERLKNASGMRLLPETMYLGAGKSHHQVILGSVQVSDEVGSTETVDVALKEYVTSSGKAFSEMATLQTVAQRGLKTFNPLAIYKSGEHSVLITEKFNNLFVLDSSRWDLVPSDSEYEEVAKPIQQMASGLAKLHSKGIFHGDAVPKNFAVDDKNDIVYFDFEDTVIVPEEEAMSTINGAYSIEESLALKDVVHFWRFQTSPYEVDKPFLITEPPEIVLNEFVVQFLNPYLDSLSELSTQTDELFNRNAFYDAAVQRMSQILGLE